MKNKKGQLTIFIIIAIVVIAGVAAFFVFRGSFTLTEIPPSIEPVYNSFLSCLEEDTLAGISILGSHAGYIELPEFQPASIYMPFSNQLDFLGNGIPYWYYVSGNNIQKEQVPSEKNMEEQLADYISEKARDCNFENYHDEGFEVLLGEPSTEVRIDSNDVEIRVNMDFTVERGNDTALVRNHRVIVNSKLGTLYNSAKKIYEYEQNSLFLEEQAIDTLRLYAPVDGVELTCAPLTWNTVDVFDRLQDAIEANTQALKTQGGEFTLKEEENKYFIKGVNVEGDVRFLNSKSWSYGFEVNPSDGNALIAEPVGNNQGLGILGFCYAPYHFVYDVKYPVLVQIFENEELFQFPLAVVIQGNNPREALETNAVEFDIPELCAQKNTEIQVNVFDTKLDPVDAEIDYKCFSTKCDIGSTSFGVLKENFPQCVNGEIIVKAEGYKDKSYQYSTIDQGIVDIFIDKLYEINVSLKLDNVDYERNATVSFISEDGSLVKTIVYPNNKKVELSEGQYEIQVSMYRSSNIRLGAVSQEKCIEVPQSGFGGFFGFTQENCFNIDLPSQVVSNALSGGGKQNYYILESELAGSNIIEINSQKLPTPTSIEQLQNNYILFDERNLNVDFKNE